MEKIFPENIEIIKIVDNIEKIKIFNLFFGFIVSLISAQLVLVWQGKFLLFLL